MVLILAEFWKLKTTINTLLPKVDASTAVAMKALLTTIDSSYNFNQLQRKGMHWRSARSFQKALANSRARVGQLQAKLAEEKAQKTSCRIATLWFVRVGLST